MTIDVELLLDNAACAAQEFGLLRKDDGSDTVLRDAVRRVIGPLLPVVEAAVLAMDRTRPVAEVRKDHIRLRDAVATYLASKR